MVEGAPEAAQEEAVKRSPQGMVEASTVRDDRERLMSVGFASRPPHPAVRP